MSPHQEGQGGTSREAAMPLLHDHTTEVDTMTKAKEPKEPIQQPPVFEEKQPALERSISLSKDGKWLILKTIRTDILHVNYLRKILDRE